jgi:hypothetical protein
MSKGITDFFRNHWQYIGTFIAGSGLFGLWKKTNQQMQVPQALNAIELSRAVIAKRGGASVTMRFKKAN